MADIMPPTQPRGPVTEATPAAARAATPALHPGAGSSRPRAWLRAPLGPRLLIIAIYAAATAAYLLLVRPNITAGDVSPVPWPLLALGFAVADLKTVNVHFRRNRHAYSLSEVPAVIGLYALTPSDFVVALAVGTAAGLLLETRQIRVRRTFNMGLALLVGTTLLGAFHAFAGVEPSSGIVIPQLRDSLTAVGACALTSVVGTLCVAAIITLSGVDPRSIGLRSMVEFGLVVAVTNASVALVAALVLATQPAALLLLVVPIATLYFAYRAYLSEREKHARLELLYESSRILQDSPELDATVLAVLEHARRMFAAEASQLVIFQGRLAALATTSVAGGEPEIMRATRHDTEPPLWRRVREERRAFFWDVEPGATLAGRPLRQVIVSPLATDSRTLGMLVVANRTSQGTEFAPDDLPLLETVASQVGIALENGQLERSLGELSRLKEQLRHQAYHDALTGLPNRVLFAEQVDLRLAARVEAEAPVVLFLDLDDFKNVNDTLGHGVGDRLLVTVAERIRECIRTTDIAARLGGDEFAVLLDAKAGMVDAVAVAERLVETLRRPFLMDGAEIMVGASVGIAAGRADTVRGDELLRNADVAMYTAKSQGKRRLAVFDPQLHAELVARHQLSAELSRSLGRGELLVHYQPIFDLPTRRIAGAEALVRWRHPTRGLVPPDEFVRLAEENGSIDALGSFVLQEACRQAATWQHGPSGGDEPWISVNVSPRQLQQPGFTQEVERILAATGLAPHRLVLEMTETGMFHDQAATISCLSRLRELGVRVAMDDFGTGYSSLSFLRRFPIDILKIAREFIAGADGAGPDESDWAFTQAIVALGHTLDLDIIAEGIEEPAQLERLDELGCRMGQGFLFARPLPPDELTPLLPGVAGDHRAAGAPEPSVAVVPGRIATGPTVVAHGAAQGAAGARAHEPRASVAVPAGVGLST
jgi:diguanylate cyclase (GGDEF)-like protein